ncbi:hypothetical protein PAMP_016653 [Pampus punctatissimus]
MLLRDKLLQFGLILDMIIFADIFDQIPAEKHREEEEEEAAVVVVEEEEVRSLLAAEAGSEHPDVGDLMTATTRKHQTDKDVERQTGRERGCSERAMEDTETEHESDCLDHLCSLQRSVQSLHRNDGLEGHDSLPPGNSPSLTGVLRWERSCERQQLQSEAGCALCPGGPP